MKHLLSLHPENPKEWIRFEVVFLEGSFEFLQGIDRKHYEKILFNIRKVQIKNDPELFKKLSEEIWEFRTLFENISYRLLAFWDRIDGKNTFVICTHGFVKKRRKTPPGQILKAKKILKIYFEEKIRKKI